MASRWFGRNRRNPQEQTALTAARDGAVAAFLDLDTRQRFVTEAIRAVRQLNPQSRLVALWKPVEQGCFDATDSYLASSNQFDLDSPAIGVNVAEATAAFQRVHHGLVDAAKAVDGFYQQHRIELDHAVTAIAATPRIGEEAVRTALEARAQLEQHSAVAQFRSVRNVAADLDQATAALDRALAAASATGVREAADQIRATGQEVTEVLEAARSAGSRAATALTSVRTRIDAVNTHIERIPPARSALLREFSAPNSADLVGNFDLASKELEAGREAWRKAGAELSAGRAEDALDLLAASRQHLNKATAACDQVTDRLSALKAVQADSSAAQRQTRFAIRDAQRLVVDRGLTAQWGSVLDAQARRVEVARDRLVGAHPNYWAYLSELASVDEFVKGVVQRIRDDVKRSA